MKIKKSTYLPAILLAYLLFMSYMGRDLLYAGRYGYFFTIFGISLAVIVLLHFTLKKRERAKNRQQDKSEQQERNNPEKE